MTLWPVAHQAPLSMGFPRQEYWSGLSLPSQGYLPDPGIEPVSLASSALAGRFFTTESSGKPSEISHLSSKQSNATYPWHHRGSPFDVQPVLFTASLVAQTVKLLPTMRETLVQSWEIPWVRKIPWRRKWQPTPVLLPGKSHGWRRLVGYSPWGHRESDMTE